MAMTANLRRLRLLLAALFCMSLAAFSFAVTPQAPSAPDGAFAGGVQYEEKDVDCEAEPDHPDCRDDDDDDWR